ncbi:MAG TPA: universal stress protein [Blastocatellia bacterium]|nr:universal stress protein [Blastocatellia bacterium]
MERKSLLVAVDFSENAEAAFEVAYDLARELGAKLFVLHVQDENILRTAIREDLFDDCATDEELEVAVKKLNQERLSKLLSIADPNQVEIEHHSQRGDPKALIVERATNINAYLLIVGRRGVSLIDRVVGHVTDSVIRKSPCPVVIVRREHRKQ